MKIYFIGGSHDLSIIHTNHKHAPPVLEMVERYSKSVIYENAKPSSVTRMDFEHYRPIGKCQESHNENTYIYEYDPNYLT